MLNRSPIARHFYVDRIEFIVNAVEIEEAVSALAEQEAFDAAEFPCAFLQAFGNKPADGFNLDHVVIAPQGVFVIETKTWSKPWSKARIHFDGERILVNGRVPDRDPVTQVRAEAAWLARMLAVSTGKRFAVRGVVVFPGWRVEVPQGFRKGHVWVLEPQALPAFICYEPVVMPEADVRLAVFHLSRYVRAVNA